jgi:hypothetical protein
MDDSGARGKRIFDEPDILIRRKCGEGVELHVR